MKHFSKSVLTAAAMLVAVGLALTIAGRAMGGETTMLVDAFGHEFRIGASHFGFGFSSASSTNRFTGDARTNGAQDLAAFDAIDVDVDFGDVVIESGGSYGVALEWSGDRYELQWSNEGGLLSVWSTDDFGPSFDWGGYDALVTITVPQGADLNSVSIDADMGKVRAGSFQTQDLTVYASMGDVDLRGVSAGSAWLNLDMGKLTMDSITAAMLDATASMGKISGTNMDVSDSMTAQADMGGVDLRGTFRNYVKGTADMGSLRLDNSLTERECNYDLTVDMGSIHIDGRKMDSEVSGGSGDTYLNLTASMGSIELNFGV